ncbi:arginine--tRNA ligase [Marinicrinis lubricantis]|uniref:Arginine--tRNA ligase n=1 Tax=Marinicrinis lubricantis TaxID=2086470 RepID=A0ABW1IU91_9BACL
MIKDWIASKMEDAVQHIYGEMGQEPSEPSLVQVQIEQPVRLEQGDYSSNIAMQLAKVFKKPPMYIAERIKTALDHQADLMRLIQRSEVAAPGFINMFVDWGRWSQIQFELPAAPAQKVIIEHTSINPNKSAHIGHLRNACIGDTLVRMLRRIGCQVEVHNYIDDLGNQLADTLVGLLHVPQTAKHHRFGDYCWELYAKINKMYAENPELSEKRIEVLHALEEGDNNTAWLGMLTAERIVREHIDELKQFGIEHDLLVWESDIVREGIWEAAFQRLMQTPLFHKEEAGPLAGCWVLKQVDDSKMKTAESDHRYDKVLVRSNGILTYTAKDIAYHLWKFGLLGRDFKYKAVDGGLWTTAPAGGGEEFRRGGYGGQRHRYSPGVSSGDGQACASDAGVREASGAAEACQLRGRFVKSGLRGTAGNRYFRRQIILCHVWKTGDWYKDS